MKYLSMNSHGKIRNTVNRILMSSVFLFGILMPVIISAQNHALTGQIKGLNNAKIYISDFYGNENKPIDSVQVLDDGSFTYNFRKGQLKGMFRLRFGNNLFMDIIYNYEDIAFTTSVDATVDSLVFTRSVDNQLYFEYLSRRNMSEYRRELLDPVIVYYPDDDPFYDQVVLKYDTLVQDLDDFITELIAENPETFVAGIVKADHTPIPDPMLPEQVKMDYMRAHFFDNIDFTDTSLLRTNVIANKVLQYLSLYQNNRMPKDRLEVEFIKAVRVIMDASSVNQVMYEYIMDYLIGGFESYGFEKVITYIADNIFLDETCVNSERKEKLENKVETLKKFAVGKQVPDFTATDINGNEITLSEIGSEYTLLVFWATWCPHCVTIVPKLKELYLPGNKEKLEIIAVSLDDSKEELEPFLAEGNYDWINIADYKKWQGDVVQLYDIYATPTMFLIYKDRTILAKPMNFNEVKHVLFERNILH